MNCATHAPFGARSHWLWMAVILFGLVPVNHAGAHEIPPPDKGSIESGGKFVPKPSGSGEVQDAGASSLKDLNIERLGQGNLRIGQVTLDQSARTIRFQAAVNMTKGPVEYLVVVESGKVHESVFVTRCSPRDIHLAMLLLGVKPGEMIAAADRSLVVPDASAVAVNVEWQTNGPPAVHPLASMISLADGQPGQDTGRTLGVAKWFYKGSVFDGGGFAAQREGSIISVIGDPAALVNNPSADREHDDLHVPNAKLLPQQGMPVTIVISFPVTPAKP